MKNYSLLLNFLSIILLTACSSNSGTSEVIDEKEATAALNGVFYRGSDTLKIAAQVDTFGKSIAFDISVTNKKALKVVFNEAPLIDQSIKMEHYRLKNWISGDTSYVAYELIDLTFNFENDSWTVGNTIIITDHTVALPTFTDLEGTFQRAN